MGLVEGCASTTAGSSLVSERRPGDRGGLSGGGWLEKQAEIREDLTEPCWPRGDSRRWRLTCESLDDREGHGEDLLSVTAGQLAPKIQPASTATPPKMETLASRYALVSLNPLSTRRAARSFIFVT